MVEEPWQYVPQLTLQLRVVVVNPDPQLVLHALGEPHPPQEYGVPATTARESPDSGCEHVIEANSRQRS